LKTAGLTKKLALGGFDVDHMKCQIMPYAANNTDDIEPTIKINTARGFNITGKAMMDL